MRPGLLKPPQISALVGRHDHQPDAAFAVLDEQVLAVQAGDPVVPGSAFLHREKGRMFDRAVLDGQPVE